MPLDIDALRVQRPETEFHYFASIDSTMREAARLAGVNAPHGTVVVADEQTAGIGRLGRSWHSEAETGLYCSVLLRLRGPSQQAPIITLLLGLATAAALEQTTDLVCDLRWPNDVLVDGNKVAGILAHLLDDCIVAGIGINVNQSALPDGLRTPATSLRLASNGRVYSRESILLAVLGQIDAFLKVLSDEGAPAIIRAFTAASSYALNRKVLLEETGQQATTAGLDEQGFLRVRFGDGRMERLAAGGVRPVL